MAETGAGRQGGTPLALGAPIGADDVVAVVLASNLPPARRRDVVREIRGVSLKAIASAATPPVSRQAVAKVMAGGRSEALEPVIAEHLRAPVEALFPEHYETPATALLED